MSGDSVDKPRIANLVEPQKTMTVNGMKIDMIRFAEAAGRLGADKHDVLSISGFRNAKGDMTPDYDSIRVERKSEVSECEQ